MQEITHPRQRASAACVFCHSRKVKCDALSTFPCTKCKESNLQCTLRTSNRGKTRRTEPKSYGAGRAAGSPHLYHPSLSAEPSPDTAANSVSETSDEILKSLENFIKNPHRPVDDKHSTTVLHATNNNAFTTILNATGDTEQDTHRNLHIYVGDSHRKSTVDRYKDAVGNLDKETRAFLASKGIFDWPQKPLADHLVDRFFEYADPHMPILDKRDFLRSYAEENVSPLLLHSVMFAASRFADPDQIDISPWQTLDNMASYFFEKARLVADFELEKDQITLVQSYILISDHLVGWTEERNARYWMSRAINIAYMMGLHREIETLNLNPTKKRLWNRISWIIVARDAMVSATFGTPVIIDDRWTDKAYPERDSVFYDESEPGETDYVSLRSPAVLEYCNHTLLNALIVTWTLCRIHATSRTGHQRAQLIDTEEVKSLLGRCLANCPSLIDIELQDSSSMSKVELLFKPMVRISHAASMIFYHWALISINEDPALKQENREKTRVYAIQLCETMGYLREHELLSLCPFWLITCVFHAIAVLLDDCRQALMLSHEAKHTRSIGYLRELNEDLGIIEKTWKPAGWFREITRASLARLKENVRKRKRQLEEPSDFELQRQQRQQQQQQQQQQEQRVQEAPTSLFEFYGLDEPFANLYESTRVHFPDFENLFTWEVGDDMLPSL